MSDEDYNPVIALGGSFFNGFSAVKEPRLLGPLWHYLALFGITHGKRKWLVKYDIIIIGHWGDALRCMISILQKFFIGGVAKYWMEPRIKGGASPGTRRRRRGDWVQSTQHEPRPPALGTTNALPRKTRKGTPRG